MTNQSILNGVRNEFEQMKVDERYTSKQKAIKYSELMTVLENTYHLPLLEPDFSNSNVDEEVKSLYLTLSKERELG